MPACKHSIKRLYYNTYQLWIYLYAIVLLQRILNWWIPFHTSMRSEAIVFWIISVYFPYILSLREILYMYVLCNLCTVHMLPLCQWKCNFDFCQRNWRPLSRTWNNRIRCAFISFLSNNKFYSMRIFPENRNKLKKDTIKNVFIRMNTSKCQLQKNKKIKTKFWIRTNLNG